MVSTSPARTIDLLGLVFAEPEAERAFEDVGELLVLVRVPRHDAALLEVDVREHHALAGDEPPVEQAGLSASFGMSSQR